ncbi:hypothetical protein Fmac_000059 [Flemingia macrophylla]|uniref:Uncharacterized protein n=1 Tax=Flemingia macrophylla TaxID=520843 RepID=A0ABD1ND71_9FABA
MERLYRRSERRGSEWKQVSAPPGHFLTIFGIVIALFSFSSYKDYKAHLHTTLINFHLFLFLLPLLFIFFIVSYSTTASSLNFHSFRPSHQPPFFHH